MLINQQINHAEVPNPIKGLPSVSTTDLVQMMRIDKTMGSDRIAGYISDAYDNINAQIPYLDDHQFGFVVGGTCVWESAPALISHHHRLSSNIRSILPHWADGFLTLTQLVTHHRWQRTYKRAVLNEAAALMADNYMDFDTIGQGITRGNNEQTKSDALRRIVNHAVADLTGKSRNRVRLL